MLDAKTDGDGDGGPVVGFIGGRRTGLMGGSAASGEKEQVKRAAGIECRRTIKGRDGLRRNESTGVNGFMERRRNMEG